ncbi:hypothetical protein [Sphingomonas sp. Leaf23]|nr:hypothetical protein [Sphingomonas sp. Leaf23]
MTDDLVRRLRAAWLELDWHKLFAVVMFGAFWSGIGLLIRGAL